jgi:hypothetical protein
MSIEDEHLCLRLRYGIVVLLISKDLPRTKIALEG